MKNLKKVLALVLAVVMIMSVVTVASAKTYTDVKATDNYANAIDALSSLNILDGFKDGDNYSFKADGTFTRAQAAKIVAIVHNAATNGKIKGQDAISALYSNAQNPFVDCNSSWALPFINYCRITGLADGMTATTYEPNRYVTGVQFLKLMLTTLNFDTNKEGYTGTGWDVNVLNRANEVGLTAGLAKGWKAIAPITRGEAAQVLYNALTKYLVEYGQLVKNNYVNKTDKADGYYKSSFISNEQVAQSGYTLAKKMGITIARATDAFRRPGYTWSYGTWSGFYMDTPVAEYKNSVTECEILKDVIGIPETKNTVVTLDGGNKGKIKADETLNYYAVDGYKWNKIELGHDNTMNCKKTPYGCQGTLTQIFETEDGYVMTSIHTFLADVLTVKAVDRKTHATGNVTTLQAYTNVAKDYPEAHYSPAVMTGILTLATADYTVGTKLDVTISYKAQQDKGTSPVVVNHAVAETKVGKLTGASDMHYPETTSIDGTQYYNNCTFTYGKDSAMSYANRNTAFTFYFDSYGNVIGCGPVAASSEYVVMTKIYSTHEKGEFALKADLYDLNGSKLEDVTVSNKAGSFKGASEGRWTTSNVLLVDALAKNNFPQLTNALYSYTVDADSVYTLNWVGVYPSTIAEYDGLGRFYGTFYHEAKRANVTGYDNSDIGNLSSMSPVGNVVVNVTESTKFVCEGVNGEWKAYTGYTALPALSASYVDYVDYNEDGYADVVYLGKVSYAGDKIIGYVPTWEPFNWAGEYDVITVYVKGEAVKVNLLHADQFDDPGDKNRDPGMYEFETAVDEDGVTYCTVKAPLSIVVDREGVVSQGADKTAIQVGNNSELPAIGLTGVAIYAVDGDTVTAVDMNYIIPGDYVVVYKDVATGEIVEIYVVG